MSGSHHEISIDRLLSKMIEVEASDLHIKVGSPPVMRLSTALHRIEMDALTKEDANQLLMPLVPERLHSQLDRTGGVDFSHTVQSNRFRCNLFRAGNGLHAAIRRVSTKIPDFNRLNLPPIYERVAERVEDGLVIICGVTGSGKSSTMASMINAMNHQHAYNIITIEDPVEYLFVPDKSIISQREVGLDVFDFESALRGAVRQDPDVIVIGEMRDKETLMAALMAAETGHLVFVTLHTSDAVQSFSRILDFFSPSEHEFVRSLLANGLRAVMAQRLLPSRKAGVVPATEVLLNSPIVSQRIREGEYDLLHAVIADSIHDGMHSFTDSLTRLVNDGFVDLKVAESFAPSPEKLHSRIHGINIKLDGLISRLKH